MSILRKIIFLNVIYFLSLNSVFAGILNDKENEFYKTQTGSYLQAIYPKLRPEQAVKAAIDDTVTTHKQYIQDQSSQTGVVLFDYNKKEEEINRLYDQVEGLLQKEVENHRTHTIFYHGFSSGMASYNAILKEFMSVATMTDISNSHPLHYKTGKQDYISNMGQFLGNNRYYKAHLNNVQMLKDLAHKDPLNYGKYKNIKAFNFKKKLGVGKAPDSSDYARQHLKSVNLSLFGNNKNMGECSFLFYLTSGNIGKFDDFLTTKLLKDVGILTNQSTAQEIEEKVSIYKDIFAEKMAQGGGGMIQILMKNSVVDKFGYASWAKGIPYFIDRKTGRFITRGGTGKAIPFLGKQSKNLVMPSLLKMVNDYKRNPVRFSKKYSYKGLPNNKIIDRFQARLFVNPKLFSNEKYVQINSTTRNAITTADKEETHKKLRAQIRKDLSDSISKNQLTSDFSDRFELGKLKNFIFGKGKFSEVIDVIFKSTKSAFTEAFDLIKGAVNKISNAGKNILMKLNLLNSIESVFENIKDMGKYYGKQLIYELKKIF